MLTRALQFVGFVVISGSPLMVKAGELETLRARCAEQERQIRELEQENAQLREAEGAPAKAVARPPGSPAAPVAPAASAPTHTAASVAPAAAPKDEQQPVKPSKPVVAKAAVAPAPAVPTYKVKQGDTYFSIGKKFRVSPDALQAANPKVKATALRPGLVIRLAKAAPPKRPAPPPPVQTGVPEKGRMAAAETPALTAAPSQLVTTTAPRTPNVTRTTVKEAAPAAAKQPAAPAPKPAAAPVKQASASGARRVVLEDSIRFNEFAQRHGTTVQRLNALNNLNLPDSILLAKGADLMVPAQPNANSALARP